jgi:hypothetical protein
MYVDNTLFFSPRQEYIDKMIIKSEASGLSLEAENDITVFLGVLIERRGDGTILMTQPGLIHRIVKALQIDCLSPRGRPPSMELSERMREERMHMVSTATQT